MPPENGKHGLTTIQFASGGLFDAEPVGSYVHLVAARENGGCGPILCGLDRFRKDAPGWSIGGGVTGPNGETTQTACPRCDAQRDPAVKVRGLFAPLFAAEPQPPQPSADR